jgi:heme exporter protein D
MVSLVLVVVEPSCQRIVTVCELVIWNLLLRNLIVVDLVMVSDVVMVVEFLVMDRASSMVWLVVEMVILVTFLLRIQIVNEHALMVEVPNRKRDERMDHVVVLDYSLTFVEVLV